MSTKLIQFKNNLVTLLVFIWVYLRTLRVLEKLRDQMSVKKNEV